jgi:transcriptional regulator with XRE-family HTH domain
VCRSGKPTGDNDVVVVDGSAVVAGIGKRVRRARDDAHQTRQESARVAGLQRSYLAGVERGQRNASILALARIASALNLDVSELL